MNRPLKMQHPRLVTQLEREALTHRAGPALAPYLETALASPLREFLSRPGKELRARLTTAAWELAGGQGAVPEALPMIVEALHAGSLIIDDIEDGSTHRRGAAALHRKVGVPLALNAGNWLYFWAFELLGRCGLDPGAERDLGRAMVTAMLRCHEGQALDLAHAIATVPQADVEPLVSTTTSLKTGTLMELAARLGARAASEDEALVASIADFGRWLGVGLQMLDDLGSLDPARDASKRYEDLWLQRPTWPWAWLADLPAPDFAALQLRAWDAAQGEGSVGELAEDMRERLGSRGTAAAGEVLQLALQRLEAEVGPSRALERIADDLLRLGAISRG